MKLKIINKKYSWIVKTIAITLLIAFAILFFSSFCDHRNKNDTRYYKKELCSQEPENQYLLKRIACYRFVVDSLKKETVNLRIENKELKQDNSLLKKKNAFLIDLYFNKK